MAGTFVSSSQEYTKKNRKVTIFTPEEKDNLQQWFKEEVEKMKLTKEEEDEYDSILTYYMVKIARLDDKDKDFTKEELKIEAEKLLAKQDAELKLTLTAEQYAIHKEIFGEFIRAVYTRWGIE
jgi:hypothetical protein